MESISLEKRLTKLGITDYITTTTNEIKQAIYERKRSVVDDFHAELVIGRSEILDYDDVINIERHLIRKTGPWYLTFSTSLDGRSLPNLYNKMEGLEGPVLIIMKDTNKNVFGALLSDSVHLSDDYYGDTESFLFKMRPFQFFSSTKSNHFFIRGDADSIVIGSDQYGHEDQCALKISKNITEGRSGSSTTFGNPPLVTENQGKFAIKALECWHFSYVC